MTKLHANKVIRVYVLEKDIEEKKNQAREIAKKAKKFQEKSEEQRIKDMNQG